VRGGESTWQNLVCACKTCNLRKAAKTPEEANMHLRTKPERPQYLAVVVLAHTGGHETWAKYMPDAAH
jgi:5-methylcytosine-specific restriction endonuclease McrA